jgi:kanamycin kinase
VAVHLESGGTRALPFYEKLGYEIVGAMEGYPPGSSHHYLRKWLGHPVRPQSSDRVTSVEAWEAVVPPALRSAYGDRRWEVAYRGERAVTYRASSPSGEALFVKIGRLGPRPTFEEEFERLEWARAYLPVPVAIEVGSDGGIEWLVTREVPGVDAITAAAALGTEVVVRELARGLRRFHATDLVACPFDFRLDAALGVARDRLAKGQITPSRDFHVEHRHLPAAEAVSVLEHSRPAFEDLVVSHGDYCAPNILFRDGVAAAFLDLGELGIADRWWDLAVATWSIAWNFGEGYEELFLQEYGVAPDTERTKFFRLLYDVVS